jgi:cystathionine gamma-synthase
VPARMTHASTSEASFATPGNLVRLSVGLESAADLVADLEQALAGSVPQAGARERTAS